MASDRLAIRKILGNCNIVLIAPHAPVAGTVTGEGDIGTLAETLAGHLDSFAVINRKYKKSIVDLDNVQAIRKRKKVEENFLLPVIGFKEEIASNDLTPLVVILQPATDRHTGPARVLFGYGQGERGNPERPHRPTMPPSLLSRIRLKIEDNGIRTDLAPTSSPYTGRERYCLNQLFHQKKKLREFFDPAVRSMLITLSADLVTDSRAVKRTASILAASLQGLRQTMSLVRKVNVAAIDTVNPEDLRFIFRLNGQDPTSELMRRQYIEELAASIRRNGLLHPLVLLQKHDGRYKILCGFRRFQAIKKLGWQWVDAKVYAESDFSTEDFFNISLAENTKRKNLNPIEIGNFLEAAARELGLNNAQLAQRFGESLGIGRPGRQVSQSTIHKYRKVNRMREKGESPQIIADVINERLQFSIAAEVLAPISDPDDRNSLYNEVIRPLAATRPQIIQIIDLLKQVNPSLRQAIDDPDVSRLLRRATEGDHRAAAFIRLLREHLDGTLTRRRERFEAIVDRLRRSLFGDQANKRDFNITAPSRLDRDECTLHIRVRSGNRDQVLEKLRSLAEARRQLDELLALLDQ